MLRAASETALGAPWLRQRRIGATPAPTRRGALGRARVCGALCLLVASFAPRDGLAQDARVADDGIGDLLAPPPLRPFKSGFALEGSVGAYVPTGELARLCSPAVHQRLTLGWDFARWLAAYGFGDLAFLATDRAPPPPGEKGFAYWGFGIGIKLSVPLGERWLLPVRIEGSFHRAEDSGVLATYGFADADKLSLGYGGGLGLEWRAKSRHYGVVLELSARRESGLSAPRASGGVVVLMPSLGLHYTL
jgi:hypothetical protein